MVVPEPLDIFKLTPTEYDGRVLSNIGQLKPSRHDHGEPTGCGRIPMLPFSRTRPFGIDLLVRTLTAERERKLPVLSLTDHENYGDTYGQYSGGLFTVLTRDPHTISSILSGQFSKFGFGMLRRIVFGPLLGDGIFTEDGPSRHASRRLSSSELQKPSYLTSHTLEMHFQEFLRAIGPDPESFVDIDLHPLIYQYTLDLGTESFLGVSTNLLGTAKNKEHAGIRFSVALNDALQWLATRERFKMFVWLVTTPTFITSCWTARAALESMIMEGQREEIGSAKSTFTDFLGRATDFEKARDELMNLLFASRDTTASLLCWLITVLAHEPAVLKRLEEEILSTLGHDSNRAPTDSDLTSMRYLDNVIYETLRLIPALPVNGRIYKETTTLPSGGGKDGDEPIYIPKGTLVCFSTYACQRSVKYYGEDAGEFRPKRWNGIEILKSRIRDYTFHPFLSGPRKCLGEKYALKTAKSTLCRFVQHVSSISIASNSSECRDGHDWQKQIKYQIGLIMSPDQSLDVRLTIR